MNVIQILGKATFHSDKKNADYYVIHTCYRQDGVEGLAVDGKFVSNELFNKVSVGKSYSIVYGAYNNGRAFIQDLQEVVKD